MLQQITVYPLTLKKASCQQFTAPFFYICNLPQGLELHTIDHVVALKCFIATVYHKVILGVSRWRNGLARLEQWLQELGLKSHL